MSILIKGMVKPKKCLDCPMCNSNDDCVLQDGRFDTWNEQMRGCPITDISDTNVGDTISQQAVIDAIEKNACNTQRIIDAVNNLPSAQPEPSQCWGCNCPKMERMTFSEMVHLHDAKEGAHMKGGENA